MFKSNIVFATADGVILLEREVDEILEAERARIWRERHA